MKGQGGGKCERRSKIKRLLAAPSDGAGPVASGEKRDEFISLAINTSPALENKPPFFFQRFSIQNLKF